MNPVRPPLTALAALTEDLGLGAVVVARPENVLWLSGHRPLWGAAAVVTADAGLTLCAPKRELELSPFTDGPTVTFAPSLEGLSEALRPLLGAARRVGLDRTSLLAPAMHAGGEVRLLAEGLAGALEREGFAVVDISPQLERLRAVKTPAQVERIEQAVRAGRQGLRAASVWLEPGISELEFGSLIELEVVRAALTIEGVTRARAFAFPMGGPNAAQAGNLISDATPYRVQVGDLVVVELAVCVDGYWADLTRTYCLGTPSLEQQQLMDAVERAHEAALRAVRPGATAQSVDRAAWAALEADDLGRFFTHGVGHGVGFAYHESPALNASSADVLEAGMVVTIEPAVYVPGLGGVRHENNVLVTANGHRVLGGPHD